MKKKFIKYVNKLIDRLLVTLYVCVCLCSLIIFSIQV